MLVFCGRLYSDSHVLSAAFWCYISIYYSWTSFVLIWHFFYSSLGSSSLNRSFYANMENSKSYVFQLLYGVPQGYSVSDTPLFSVLSYLIQQQSTSLYAYNTQLMLWISTLDFSHHITHLETIANGSKWVSSNFLSLNPAKTEFLITSCAAALCSVKDGFFSEVKILIFDCSLNSNAVIDQHQTWQN